MNVLITERPSSIPLHTACRALALNRSSVYARRRRASEPVPSRLSRKTAPQPRLVAQAPNEVWTWDCSKLATRTRSVYLTLYVVLDLFSRFVLAWMVSRKENSALAQQLMTEATAKYRIDAGQLTIHQDRGAPMTAGRYIDLMSKMGVVLSHSRPRVSNDNAFSEAQFKTQNYQPDYPGRFEHSAHARTWCESYFDWYNFDHPHAGLA
jgi:putative transposase